MGKESPLNHPLVFNFSKNKGYEGGHRAHGGPPPTRKTLRGGILLEVAMENQLQKFKENFCLLEFKRNNKEFKGK